MKREIDADQEAADSRPSRRGFIHASSAGLCGLAMTGAFASDPIARPLVLPGLEGLGAENSANLIGAYGDWASQSMRDQLPSHSFRRKQWADIESWRRAAKKMFSKESQCRKSGESMTLRFTTKTYTMAYGWKRSVGVYPFASI